MNKQTLIILTAGAFGALAVWPFAQSMRTPATSAIAAPLTRDYELRDRLIAFEERQCTAHPGDQITARMLASQYLQRFRERFDLSDVTRAQHLAEVSLRLQPIGNTSAQMTLAGSYLTYHQFREALVHERAAVAGDTSNVAAVAQIASLEMELGQYNAARVTLERIPNAAIDNPTVDSVRARYDELNGMLPQARDLIAKAIQTVDSGINNPAIERSWYHMRAGQLAWEAGDHAMAQREYDVALTDYPKNAMALMFVARMYRSDYKWSAALRAATQSADLYPLPQALGYEADAQRALGEQAQAAQTDALIRTEQHLFNTQGINDRLLASYYSQRNIYLPDALHAALSDYRKRGDEIYADDTVAWALAKLGRWNQARRYSQAALRLRTQDPELQYHGAVIAEQTGHTAQAAMLYHQALAEDSAFDPFDAVDARRRLADLERRS